MTGKMPLIFYNTQSRKKEIFISKPQADCVKVYVCGPTVYGASHIGNARPAVVFDVLRRVLREQWQVNFVSNITDVDDKIIAVAQKEEVEPEIIAVRYAAEYMADMARLGVQPPDLMPRASEHIAEIKKMIEVLIEKGNAYVKEGNVLFDINSFEGYGSLSNRNLKDIKAGARVEVAAYKNNPLDFVLWKPAGADGVGWDSIWGKGRPGWHIECSAMIHSHLGGEIDIHAAGSDLIFPHHENERAQSICAWGGHFVRHWMHNGMVIMDKGKMSKSLGNIITLKDLLEKWDGRVLRLALLMAHYRQPLHWTDDNIEQAQNIINKIYQAFDKVKNIIPTPDVNPAIYEALADDLNTPKAISLLSEYVKKINQTEEQSELAKLKANLDEGVRLLGIDGYRKEGVDGKILDELYELISQREEARKNKDYGRADKIRKKIEAMGGIIEDTKTEPVLRYGLTKKPL